MTDRLTVLVVVGSLATLAILSTAGVIWLAATERAIPDALISICSGTISALAALLVSTRSAPPSDDPAG